MFAAAALSMRARAPFSVNCRHDECEPFRARPFGRTRNGADLASRRIYDEGSRQAGCACNGLQRLKNLGGGIGIIRKLVDAGCREPCARLLRIARVNIHCDHFEGPAAQLLLERVELWHFFPARNAPSGPEIEQYRASAPFRQMSFSATDIVEREVRHYKPLLGDRKCR